MSNAHVLVCVRRQAGGPRCFWRRTAGSAADHPEARGGRNRHGGWPGCCLLGTEPRTGRGQGRNAVAPPRRYSRRYVFSPSADPIGAVRYLVQDTAQGETAAMDGASHDSSPAEAGILAYAGEALLARDLNLVGDDIDALPRALSVAQYVTRYRFQRGRPDSQTDVSRLVLGTPIYVAQVSKITN